MGFVSAKCSSCQKDIQLPTDLASPTCPYCNAPQSVSGVATPPSVATLLGLAGTALAGGNTKEAFDYYARVLELDPKNSEAWFGKGKAAGWQSTLVNIRLPEALVDFSHAVATASEDQKPRMLALAVAEANSLVTSIYKMARKHMLEFVRIDKSWLQYLVQVSQLLDALQKISEWSPSNRTILENIIFLCKDNIEGVVFEGYDRVQKGWALSPQYEAKLNSMMESATGRLRAMDPSYEAPPIEKKKPGCFVVSATMGDVDHPTVDLIRALRDQWILRRSWGPSLVRTYYRFGPKAARAIESKAVLKRTAYYVLVAPLAWLARRLLVASP